jgi:hypothetical protein
MYERRVSRNYLQAAPKPQTRHRLFICVTKPGPGPLFPAQ